ncbi:MAG: hypothetical protein LBF08_05965 [Dysgonamonadaceae bacterium]|jgi:hypothetical protein|nr:hypothetical protein [Dysgonamonadaceae bacterium]
MNKPDYSKEIFRLLELNWDDSECTSTGSTVTTEAWKRIYEKIAAWENNGILSVAKGLEKYKK